MKIKTLALAAALAAGGIVGGQAFAQDRDMTVTHERPDGAVVTRHVRSEDGITHRTVRVQRPDGTTVVRRTTRVGDGDRYEHMGPRRTVVIRRHYDPIRHVWVRTVIRQPSYVVNRHVTVIHDRDAS